MAFDVADKAWRLARAQRWEAEGYSRPESISELASQAGWIPVLAADDWEAAAVVRKLPDQSFSSDDLWNPYCRLAFHFGATERSLDALADADADAPTRMKALNFIAKHFKSPEDAAQLLESLAEEREIDAEKIYSRYAPMWCVKNSKGHSPATWKGCLPTPAGSWTEASKGTGSSGTEFVTPSQPRVRLDTPSIKKIRHLRSRSSSMCMNPRSPLGSVRWPPGRPEAIKPWICNCSRVYWTRSSNQRTGKRTIRPRVRTATRNSSIGPEPPRIPLWGFALR